MFQKFIGKARYFFALGCLALPLDALPQTYFRCDSTYQQFLSSTYGNGWIRCDNTDLVEVDSPTININDITDSINNLTNFDIAVFNWVLGLSFSTFVFAFGLGVSSRMLTKL